MATNKKKRTRGVILTPQGLQKFREARRGLETKDNFGRRYTFEEMSKRSDLYTSTISKVLKCEIGVEKGTIEELLYPLNK